MPKDMDQDVLFIKKWIEKESYLPQDIDDIMLRKFLHSCYGSLERTKKCIERFCTTRSEMSEVYTKRDPLSPNLQTAFSIAFVSTYVADDNEILIHQLDEPTLDKFVFYDLVKSFAIQGDFWLRKNLVFPEKHIIVLDIKDYALKIITKVNIMFFRDFVIFLLEGMPVRVKQVHVINCPSYYEKLYALVKPALPSEICEIINFHPTAEGLQKFIDKKFLPQEYGGDAQSMREQHRNWVKEIEENRSMFLDDNLWKADIKKKPKTEAAMSGSFRTLAID